MHEHETAEAVAEPAQPAAASASMLLAPAPAQLLRLQQQAGNRAVGALLRAAAGPPLPRRRALARYEPGEHVQFGTSGQNVTIGKLHGIDEKYLIAMGDFYKDPDKLLGAKEDELKELMALIDRDEKARTGGGGTSPTEEDWQNWSLRWRKGDEVYMELNKANEAHFAPRNKARWEELHTKALKEAQSSGNGSGVPSQKARIINGFAAHFLTDAFSAGHMIDKKAVMAAAKTSLNTGTNRDTLAAAIATGILADKGAAAALAGQEIKDGAVWGDWGPPTQPRMASLLSSVMRWKEGEFLSIFARIAHDDLNTAIGFGKGLWVWNLAGDRWQLSGDTTLDQSSKTLEVGRKAVAASEQNLRDAAAIKSPPAWKVFTSALSDTQIKAWLDNVWQYVPMPTDTLLTGEGTQSGADQVRAAVATYTNATNADAIKAIVKLSIEQFPTAMAQLREKNLIRAAPAP